VQDLRSSNGLVALFFVLNFLTMVNFRDVAVT